MRIVQAALLLLLLVHVVRTLIVKMKLGLVCSATRHSILSNATKICEQNCEPWDATAGADTLTIWPCIDC